MNLRNRINEKGFTLAGVLTLLAVMAIFLALSLPLWSRVRQRDNEEELIFRGNEYIKGIARYHAKLGTYPPDIETLVKLKYVRHEYLDPMTKSGKWKVLHPDALTQTGAAGTINLPGGTNQQGQKGTTNDSKKGGKNSGDDDDDDTGSGNSLSGDGTKDDDDQTETSPSMGSEDDENKDEEPEVESVGPVVGVVSRSKKPAFKIYNGQSYYNKWTFVYALPQQQQKPNAVKPQGGGAKPPGGGKPPGGVTPPGSTNPPPVKDNSGDDDDGGQNDDGGDSGDLEI